MKIYKKWSASSDSENIVKGNELVNMAGRWNVGIEVSIIKPYTYSQSPNKILYAQNTTTYPVWNQGFVMVVGGKPTIMSPIFGNC